MIAYITLGANDIEKARAFYGGLLAEMGAKELFDNNRLYFYGTPGQPMIAVGGPYDGQAASAGNGTMVAIPCPDTETVDKMYKKGLELGATCDGEPGERVPGFYGAYLRDADQNKLCFCKMG